MSAELKQMIADNVLFAKEAADYLGISIQRLHQLTHAGQITPLKQSGSGTLFYKQDLEERKKSIQSIGKTTVKRGSFEPMKIDSDLKQEALNYFTVQAFFKNSDKKTAPIFEKLKLEIDATKPLVDNQNIVADFLNISTEMLEAEYFNTLNGFKLLKQSDIILKKGEEGYPERLAVTDTAPPFIFARGNIDLLKEKIVAVVGTRQPSETGKQSAYRLSEILGRYNIVVASGLARGIDTQAHAAAVEHNNCMTVSVIGTSLAKAYPAENSQLQELISEKGLVISQFAPSEKVQRWFFPMRNAVMSGISLATVVIEAGETSGALKQADYALKQGRYVFIPQSALDNEAIKWPRKYIQRPGAYSFRKINELLEKLQNIDILKTSADKDIALFNDSMEEVEYVSAK